MKKTVDGTTTTWTCRNDLNNNGVFSTLVISHDSADDSLWMGLSPGGTRRQDCVLIEPSAFHDTLKRWAVKLPPELIELVDMMVLFDKLEDKRPKTLRTRYNSEVGLMCTYDMDIRDTLEKEFLKQGAGTC